MTKEFIKENYLTKAGRLKPNLNIEVYRIYLILNDLEEPKCKYCNKTPKFISLSKGFRDTCCSKNCLSKQNKEKQAKAKRPNKENAIREYKEKCKRSEYWEALESYISFGTAIKHRCRFCGNTENISPKAITTYRKGKGINCRICSKRKHLKAEHLIYLKEIKERSIDVVPLECMLGRDLKSLHLCSCGEEWKIKPYDVLRGIHCYECSGGFHTAKFYMGKKTILYYIKIAGLWKIGVTLFRGDVISSLKRRFGADNYEVIYSKVYSNGAEAYYQEQEILQNNSAVKYAGSKVINHGNTEIFSEDIRENILSIFIL